LRAVHPADTELSAALPARAWYREVTRDQWTAFTGSYLAWVLDGFDYTILTFLLVDVQRSFDVNATLAGLLGQITLMFRLVGGIGAGTAADRHGRKGPLMFSILWYSAFACLSGFSTSYGMLFTCRALFGIGMGGVWAAGMPLTLEHWPAHLRGRASGMMQSGYSLGFLLSALVFQFGYPLVSHRPDLGWRAMLWIGVLPALLVLFIMNNVKESPVWLARQRHLRDRRERDPLSLGRLFSPSVLATTIHTSIMMGAFLFMYHSITYWYPTMLVRMGRPALPFLLAFNGGAILGAVAIGRLSETALGRRGAAILATLIGVATVPTYVFTSNTMLLGIGALAMGFFGAGNFGVVPAYLTERFPTVARAAGAGFAYHAGAGLGSFTPTLVGHLQDRGLPLPTAIAVCIAASGVILTVLIASGPETRGTEYRSEL
jgi:SHS family lactate transporter-like MFS transporter